jgi:5-methylthioribose kinase
MMNAAPQSGARELPFDMTTDLDGAGDHFQLNREDLTGLKTYLIERGFAQPDETVVAELAGEGNMNCVIRVRLPGGSLILKQARPWVEKYPSIAAPVERAASEARFYRFATRESLIAAMMPRLLEFDEKAALLVMEDLFAAEPLIDCYQGSRQFSQRQLNELAKYTFALHSLVVPANERDGFRNTAMRRLSHEHIFDFPLRDDGALSEMLERITPGLDHVAADLRQDRKYCDIVRTLGDRYLQQDGPSLIHGDLFPGSLLQTGTGELRIIDPEFCFCGDPEFDIGVFYAHLLLSGHGEDALTWWLKDALQGHEYSDSLVFQYAGVEIMRRILGVAQLPVRASLEAKRRLLEQSRAMVLQGVPATFSSSSL